MMGSASRAWTLIAAVLCLLAAPLAAQDRLPPTLINTSSALSPEQQQLTDSYIHHWVTQLTTGTDEQVTRARDKMIEPMVQGPSKIFASAYSASLGIKLLQEGLNAERLIVRLNAMMIASRLTPADAVAMVEKGLQDGNPAIRYAAARAANDIASREDDKAPAPIQIRLLDALTNQLNGERVQLVLEQVLLSVSGLDIPEASDRLLNGLNQRVALHVKEPATPAGADREAMARLFRRYVLQAPENDEVVRKLTQVAFRHLDLSVRLLEGGKQPEAVVQDRLAMALLADRILRWAAERRIAPGAKLPESVEKALPAGNTQLARVYIEEWRKLLTTEQAGFVQAQLALPD
jgi:hypothetical protein